MLAWVYVPQGLNLCPSQGIRAWVPSGQGPSSGDPGHPLSSPWLRLRMWEEGAVWQEGVAAEASRGAYGAASQSGRLPRHHTQGTLLHPVSRRLPRGSIQHRKATKGALSPGAGEAFWDHYRQRAEAQRPKEPDHGRLGTASCPQPPASSCRWQAGGPAPAPPLTVGICSASLKVNAEFLEGWAPPEHHSSQAAWQGWGLDEVL